MSILLAGGGEPEALRPFVERFVARVRARAKRPTAKIVAVAVGGAGERQLAGMRGAGLAGDGIEVLALVAETTAFGEVREGFDGGELLSADGVLVCDGDPRALLAALEHRVGDLRRLAHELVPYFGIGGGAVIAAEGALVVGNAIGGVQVAPGKALAEAEIKPGVGLVDLAVVTQTAQEGRLGLAVASCEAGLIDRALCLDAGTALEISEQGLDLSGSGSLWQVTVSESEAADEPRSVVVTSQRAV